jgi:hypothetical protein
MGPSVLRAGEGARLRAPRRACYVRARTRLTSAITRQTLHGGRMWRMSIRSGMPAARRAAPCAASRFPSCAAFEVR